MPASGERFCPVSPLEARSARLIASQFASTSSVPLTSTSPNTCGWRRMSLATMWAITSGKRKALPRPRSASAARPGGAIPQLLGHLRRVIGVQRIEQLVRVLQHRGTHFYPGQFAVPRAAVRRASRAVTSCSERTRPARERGDPHAGPRGESDLAELAQGQLVAACIIQQRAMWGQVGQQQRRRDLPDLVTSCQISTRTGAAGSRCGYRCPTSTPAEAICRLSCVRSPNRARASVTASRVMAKTISVVSR